MITDAHAHLFHPSWYPPRFVAAAARGFAAKQEARGRHVSLSSATKQLTRILTDASGSTTLKIMDAAQIARRVILIVDWGIELGEAEKSIREIHEEILSVCRKSDGRLLGFAGVDPRRSDACETLAWAFDHLGARGLKLHPTGDWSLTDPRTQELVNVAAERQMPVVSHIGRTVDVLRDTNAQPEPFLRLARSFPDIPFVAGHSGFDLWGQFVARDDVPGNVLFDISGWQERVHGDGTNVLEDLTRLHRAFPGRVCFGTDSPFYSFNLIPSEKKWVETVFPPFIDRWVTVDPNVPRLFSCPPQAMLVPSAGRRTTEERRTAPREVC